MRIDVLTLFPEMFRPVLDASIPGRAQASDLVQIHVTDIRSFTTDKHGRVDDRPFGGGPGMVMTCQPVWDAVLAVEAEDASNRPVRILMTPQGRVLDQELAGELSKAKRLLIIAGRYEGIDERVIERLNPIEISIGDYVLSGGELPALVLIDTVIRLLPGVLGHENSAAEDSFTIREPGNCKQVLLDCQHYTRPRDWQGLMVPDVLLSGDHAEVERFRMNERIKRTQLRRPDLLLDKTITPDVTDDRCEQDDTECS